MKYIPKYTKKEQILRNAIFRSLISLIREEHFSNTDKNLCDYANKVFYIPSFNRSANFGSITDNEFYNLGICAVPNRILNIFVCNKLSKVYKDLSICGCFYQTLEGSWLLDIDERFSKRGLILPVKKVQGLIYGLKVFRFPDDPNPFWLKLRAR